MKTNRLRTRIISILLCICLAGCQTLQSLQASPGVEAAETAGISIGLGVATGSPAFSWLAPVVVNGLTAAVGNPTAVTGIVAQDAPLIISTVTAAIPNSAGKTAATAIASAYVTAMNGTPATATSPAIAALPATPTAANAVLAAIASGLTSASSAAPGASVKQIRHSIIVKRILRHIPIYATVPSEPVFAVDNASPLEVRVP